MPAWVSNLGYRIIVAVQLGLSLVKVSTRVQSIDLVTNLVNKNQNRVRIIAGSLRGRIIDFPNAEGLRPSGDRVRETLFSWLQAYLPDSCCLDLFAGSGAFGFESLSRGAGHVVMLEKLPEVCQALGRNAEKMAAGNVMIKCGDAISLETLNSLGESGARRFDIVFIDPPFAMQLHQHAIDQLVAADILAENALIYLESAKRDAGFNVPSGWTLSREKVAGQVRMCLYTA